MPHITKSMLNIVAKNTPKGNLSLLLVANTAMLAKKFSENKIIVTTI
jgi:hypothetical protein